MWRSRLFWRLYAGYVALVVCATAIVGLVVARRLEQESLASAERGLADQAVLVRAIAAPAFAGGTDLAAVAARLTALGRETGTRFTLLDPDGRVLADSAEDAARMDNHAGRPEVVAAREAGTGAAVRYSRTVDARLLYLAMVVRPGPRGGDPIIGFVRAAVPLDAVDASVATLRTAISLAALLAVGFALALGFVAARRVLGPLTAIGEAAAALAAGGPVQEVPEGGRDEVAALARAWNAMARELRARLETITRDRNEVRAILTGMIEGVVAIDREERVLLLNEPAARALRADAATGPGRRIWEVTRIREVGEALQRAVRDGADVAIDLVVPEHPRDRALTLHAAPLRDGEGRPAGAVAVLHDVTELRRLEAVRRDFVANVSHELKTPVTAIRGMVETCLDDAAMDEATRRRFLGRIADQSVRLSALVTDLLTLSRLESQPEALVREPLDLREPVRAAVAALGPTAERQGLALAVEAPDAPLPVTGDPTALRQVIDNLLDNAIKYTPSGGRVTARLRRDGATAGLEVADTGIGIEPRHQDRIFERFYRVDTARSREMGGTGLGLAIVKHIALAHGGRVAVESAPGVGSTFRVALPLGVA